jgi:hypothetical protein
MAQTPTYLVFLAALIHWCTGDNVAIKHELKRQWDAVGNAQKSKQF